MAEAKLSTDLAMNEIREAVESLFSGSGTNARNAQQQMDRFLQSIQPDVEEAILSGDTRSLSYLRARVLVNAGRASLGALYQQRVLVANTVVTVLRILFKVAAGTLVV